MDPRYYGLVEMAFTGLVVLGLAGWQLWSISRDVRRDRASKEAARHPVAEHLPRDG